MTEAVTGDPTLRADGLQWARLGPDEALIKRGVVEVRLAFPDISDVLDRVLALADGSRTLDTLVGAFPPQQQDEVRTLLTALRVRQLLVSPDDTDRDAASTFWRTMAPRTPDARGLLESSLVMVRGDGAVAAALAVALEDCGVGRVTTVPAHVPLQDVEMNAEWDLICVAADYADWDRLLQVSRAALQARRLLLPVWIEDLVIHVGPLTHPYDTACLRCYRLRVQSNDPRWAAHEMLRTVGSEDGSFLGAGFLPTMSSVAGQVAATEAVKQLTGLPTSTAGRALELGLVPFRSALHRVLMVPRCPDCCGTASRGTPLLMHGSQMSE